MDLTVIREDLRDALAQPNHPSQIVARIDVLEAVLDHLDGMERRAQQVEGGHYLRYGSSVEVARWIRTGNREAQNDAV